MKIAVDDLSGPQISKFLDEHVLQMRSITPPESKMLSTSTGSANLRLRSGR